MMFVIHEESDTEQEKLFGFTLRNYGYLIQQTQEEYSLHRPLKLLRARINPTQHSSVPSEAGSHKGIKPLITAYNKKGLIVPWH